MQCPQSLFIFSYRELDRQYCPSPLFRVLLVTCSSSALATHPSLLTLHPPRATPCPSLLAGPHFVFPNPSWDPQPRATPTNARSSSQFSSSSPLVSVLGLRAVQVPRTLTRARRLPLLKLENALPAPSTVAPPLSHATQTKLFQRHSCRTAPRA